MADSVQDIIEACKKRNAKAQMQFYKQYYKLIYNCCYRILLNTEDAEDCMQDAFIKAFEKIETIKDAPPEAWLRRIAINTAIDKLRSQQVDFVELNDCIQLGEEEPIREEELKWKVEQVKAVVESMPDIHRVILSLYLFEGYDYEEIAEILNSKAATVRSQFSRARQKLLEKIKKEQILCV